jgi:hypothetical protein
LERALVLGPIEAKAETQMVYAAQNVRGRRAVAAVQTAVCCAIYTRKPTNG